MSEKVTLRVVSGDGQVVTAMASETFTECVAMASRSLWVNRSLTNFLTDQIEGIRRDAAELTDDKARWNLMDSVRGAVATIAELKQSEAFLEKRLDHAIKRLQQKRLYATDIDTLSRICIERNLPKARALIQVVRCCMGEDIARVGDQADLDEMSWKIGIEIAMAQHEPELFASRNLFGPRIEDDFQYIAINAMMAAYGAKLNHLLSSEEYLEEIHSMVMDKYLKIPAISDSIIAWAAKAVEADIKAKDEKITQLEKDLGAEQAKTRDLEEKLKSAEKAATPNKTATARLNDKIAELQKALENSDGELEKYRNALDQRDRIISKLSEDTTDTNENLIPLPEDNVIFFGGHPNLVKKLKDIYPKWQFIDGTSKHFADFTPPSLIFFWDKHMVHPAWQRAMRLIGPSTVRIYLKSTNPELLEQEMLRGWTAARKDTDDDIYQD